MATSVDPLLGSVLGDRYRIEKKLGEGGMGAVYLARHVILEKIVALKILHDEYARRRELVERFLHEAKAASRIRHEHVIDITDFGETANKNVFFAMEYLDGHDLASDLDRGVIAWPRIKKVALQICAALQAAHEAGVIHRDLKPENIYLIERLGNPDYVKVLDFGVAKLTELEEGKERRLTRTGMVFGTPEYMSPEQARGEKPDARVDVYALGCILFEMVTGDVPFRADNFMGVLTKHLFDPLPLIADRTSRSDLPAGIQDVVSQALAKDKDVRFGSMNELAVAIDTLDATAAVSHSTATLVPERTRRSERDRAAHAATTPAPLPDGEPSPRPSRRLRWGLVGAAIVVAIAAAGILASQLQSPGAPAPAPAPAPAATVAPKPAAAPPTPPPAPAPAETVEVTPPAPPPEPAPVAEPPPPRKTAPAVRKRVAPRPAPEAAEPAPPPAASRPPEPPAPKSDLKDPFGGK